MPAIDLIKLKIRRGTDAQRQSVILDQGELGYTTDTQRIFVGNSATPGGVVVGNKVFTPVAVKTGLTGAVIGDTVLENSIYYQLTGNDPTNSASWVQVSPQVDKITIDYNETNKLSVLVSGLTSNFTEAIVDNDTIVQNNGIISTGTLYLSTAAPSTLKQGLTADSTGLGVYSNPDVFSYIGDSQLTLVQQIIPNSYISLSAEEKYFNTDGILDMASFVLPDERIKFDRSFFSIDYIKFGTNDPDASEKYTTFKDNLSSNNNVFGGNLSGEYSPSQLTNQILTVLNTTTNTFVSLSAAGFITLSRNITGDGIVDKRIAIPIFTY